MACNKLHEILWKLKCGLLGNDKLAKTGHLILHDGVISHNWPQIASDRTIWGKSYNM